LLPLATSQRLLRAAIYRIRRCFFSAFRIASRDVAFAPFRVNRFRS